MRESTAYLQACQYLCLARSLGGSGEVDRLSCSPKSVEEEQFPVVTRPSDLIDCLHPLVSSALTLTHPQLHRANSPLHPTTALSDPHDSS